MIMGVEGAVQGLISAVTLLCSCRSAARQRVFGHWPRCCTAPFVRARRHWNPVRTTAWMSWRAAWPIKLIWIQSGTCTLVSVFQLSLHNSFSTWMRLFCYVPSNKPIWLCNYAWVHGSTIWLNGSNGCGEKKHISTHNNDFFHIQFSNYRK